MERKSTPKAQEQVAARVDIDRTTLDRFRQVAETRDHRTVAQQLRFLVDRYLDEAA